MAVDHFTQLTKDSWKGSDPSWDDPARRPGFNREFMQRYAEPLKRYFLKTSWRTLGEPDEIVNGFFVRCLKNDDYFHDWKASGKRLRRWLMNGLLLHCRSEHNRRDDAATFDDSAEPPIESSEPERAYPTDVVKTLVERAMQTARQELEAKGMSEHWRIFLCHYLEGLPLRALGEQIGVDEDRAWVMVKTGRRRFKAAIEKHLMEEDGIEQSEVGPEVIRLLGELA